MSRILHCIFIIISFSFSNIFSQKNTLEISIKNCSKDTLKIFKNVSFLEKKCTQSFIIEDKDFNKNISLEASKPILIEISFRGKNWNVYLNSQSNIKLKVDASDLDNSLKFEGDLANENDFLNDFNNKFKLNFDPENIEKSIFLHSIDAWEMLLYEQKKQQTEFYKLAPNTAQWQPFFKDFIENQIRWNYWGSILAYPIVRGNADKSKLTVFSIPNILLEKLDKAKINQPELVFSPAYRFFLNYYVTYYNSQSKGFQKYKDQSQMLKDKHSFARENLAIEPYSYYLANLLYQYGNLGLPSTVNQIYSALQLSKDSERYLSIVKSKCESILKKTDAEVLKNNEDKKNDLLKLIGIEGDTVTLKKFRGKVLYLDIWASWCGPCRAEFPNSRTLHKRFTEKQLKEIQFLNISIDDNIDNWQEAVKKLNLDYAINLLSTGGWASNVTKLFRIASIPRYIIIDKNGNVVEENAKRPSDPRVYDDIMNYLNK
ncbi:MAG: TlpA family protein disulfide reductase [Pseudarcicella sp.]|nr:TlpA family protein disulfide reductase [Pseudarcicella sp.]